MTGEPRKHTGEGCEEEIAKAVVEVGRLMALAARTAPKGMGRDYLEVRLLTGADVERLGQAMVARGEREEKPHFARDGRGVLASQAVLLVSLMDHPPIGLDCNACGFGTCAGLTEARASAPEGQYPGPVCALRATDLGIAIGSAVKTAQLHNVDNRVMYRAAVVAIQEGLVGRGLALAVPLAATGKSPFFDR